MDIQALLYTIKVLEMKKEDSLRKVTEIDLKKTQKKNNKKNIKIKSYRAQGEHGEKKFIKP